MKKDDAAPSMRELEMPVRILLGFTEFVSKRGLYSNDPWRIHHDVGSEWTRPSCKPIDIVNHAKIMPDFGETQDAQNRKCMRH